MKLARTLLAGVTVMLVGAATASAATIEVTTTKDEFGAGGSKKCALREAIQAANTDKKFGGCRRGKGADRIVLGRGIHRLKLTGSENDNASGDLNITGPVTIVGKGERHTVVDGNGEKIHESVFDVASGRAKFVAMTIRNGWDTEDYGGAIDHRSAGNLALDRMRFVHNTAEDIGGAVYHADIASDVKITRSKFIENESADYGGGFYTDGADDVTIRNSAFVDNSADYGYGGGASIWYAEGKTLITRTKFTGNATDTNYGGGLLVGYSEKVALSKLTVTGNTSGAYDYGYGGGIYTYESGVTLRDSTVSGNVSGWYGGGIYVDGGSLKLINSTVSQNHASYYGGYGGGIYADGDVDIRSSTIAFNRASDGVGIYENAAVTYKNSIITRNRKLYYAETEDCGSPASDASLGHNFFGDDTCDTDGPGDIANGTVADPSFPRLDTLGNYGGPTRTHALLRGSPAINKGQGCPKRDQRGYQRKGRCDIGAFEFGGKAKKRKR